MDEFSWGWNLSIFPIFFLLKILAVELKPDTQTHQLVAKSRNVPSAVGKSGPTKVRRTEYYILA